MVHISSPQCVGKHHAATVDVGFVEIHLAPPPTDGRWSGSSCGASESKHQRLQAADTANSTPITLDLALTRHVGELGWGQMLMLVAASLSWMSLACVALAMVFLNTDPIRSQNWRCTDPADSACAAAWEAAPRDTVPFCALDPGSIIFDPPRLSAVSEFGLVCGEGWRTAVANSAYFVGIWLGSTPFGWFSDRAGRRICLIASNAATAAACCLCAVAPTYWVYVALRASVGFAAAGLPIGSYLLSTEAVGPSRRGVAGLLTQLVYHPGEWLLPVLAAALKDWRHLNLALGAVCALGAVAAAAIHESPRWLLTQGHDQEAERVVHWLAARNGRQLPRGVRLIMAGDEEAKERDGAARGASCVNECCAAGAVDGEGCGGCGLGREAGHQGGCRGQAKQHRCRVGRREEQGDWRLLFSHPLLRRSLVVSSLLSAVCAVVFFAAGLAADALQGYSVERAFLVTSLFEVPAYLIGVAAIDTAGRRATVFSFLMLSGLSSLGCALLGPGTAQVTLATINRGVISAAWGSAYIVTAEACITPLRSQALGISNQAARLGGVLAPAVPFLASHLRSPALPFWVMAACGIGASAAVLLLPETRGKPAADSIEQLEELYRGGGGGHGFGGGMEGRAYELCGVGDEGDEDDHEQQQLERRGQRQGRDEQREQHHIRAHPKRINYRHRHDDQKLVSGSRSDVDDWESDQEEGEQQPLVKRGVAQGVAAEARSESLASLGQNASGSAAGLGRVLRNWGSFASAWDSPRAPAGVGDFNGGENVDGGSGAVLRQALGKGGMLGTPAGEAGDVDAVEMVEVAELATEGRRQLN